MNRADLTGKLRNRQMLLRSAETEGHSDYSMCSYYDFSSDTIGLGDTEFKFVVGGIFVL